jgi:hypothetical protein
MTDGLDDEGLDWNQVKDTLKLRGKRIEKKTTKKLPAGSFYDEIIGMVIK